MSEWLDAPLSNGLFLSLLVGFIIGEALGTFLYIKYMDRRHGREQAELENQHHRHMEELGDMIEKGRHVERMLHADGGRSAGQD